jgi:hypothetical protein
MDIGKSKSIEQVKVGRGLSQKLEETKGEGGKNTTIGNETII